MRGKPTGPESIVLLDAAGGLVATLATGEHAWRTADAIVAVLNGGREAADTIDEVGRAALKMGLDDVDDLIVNAPEIAKRPTEDMWTDLNDEKRALETELSDVKKDREQVEEQRSKLEELLDKAERRIEHLEASAGADVEKLRSALARAHATLAEVIDDAA